MDYHLGVQELYTKVASYAVSEYEMAGSSIWGHWSRPSKKAISGLPTWVPDWSAAPDVNIHFRYEHASEYFLAHLVEEENVSTSDGTLYINGYIMDRVAHGIPVGSVDVYRVVKAATAALAARDISIFDPYPYPALLSSSPSSSPPPTSRFRSYLETILWALTMDRSHKVDENSHGLPPLESPSFRNALSFLAWTISRTTDTEMPRIFRNSGLSSNLYPPDDHRLNLNIAEWDAREMNEAGFDEKVCEWIEDECIEDCDLFITEKGGIGITDSFGILAGQERMRSGWNRACGHGGSG